MAALLLNTSYFLPAQTPPGGGEPVDILVNHKLIAKGEVVVIDENFGVRVTEIVSPMERMNELGQGEMGV